VTLGDIVIITPYNAQVFEIEQRLPSARVGTVDKFQGQEAPIAIYSTATSSHADAPRGMEFPLLRSAHVALSRQAVLVGRSNSGKTTITDALAAPCGRVLVQFCSPTSCRGLSTVRRQWACQW
jgi:hypothetical protein